MNVKRLPRVRQAMLISCALLAAACAPSVPGSDQEDSPPSRGVAEGKRPARELLAAAAAAEQAVLAPSDLPIRANPRFTDKVQILDGTGESVWAEGYEGELIAGLDGSAYVPYAVEAIERVQDLLRDRGLYGGPVNGILDRPTMRAIASFQAATQTLQVSGIPTPRTRLMLQQGSHTI